jgi:hypothetical protein
MLAQRFDYSGERQHHEKLVGRAELGARLDQLLFYGDGDRWVVVTGGPGIQERDPGGVAGAARGGRRHGGASLHPPRPVTAAAAGELDRDRR